MHPCLNVLAGSIPQRVCLAGMGEPSGKSRFSGQGQYLSTLAYDFSKKAMLVANSRKEVETRKVLFFWRIFAWGKAEEEVYVAAS